MQIPQEYQILSADTLHQIADKFYGDFRYWRELVGDRDIFSLEDFSPGKVINLPTKDEILKQVQDTVLRVRGNRTIDYSQLDLSNLRTANVSSVNPQTLVEWIL